MKNHLRYILLIVFCVLSTANLEAQTPKEDQAIELDSVIVIGAAPMPGSDISTSKLASVSYLLTDSQLKDVPGQFSMDQIERRVGAVHFYKASGNDRQASLNYRGFQVAPLLGLSQGIAVYLDGIRMNDLFGDVMYWDMLPGNGLKKIELAAGSNPMFGLNTLGGALQFLTKSGFDIEKNQLSVQGGSFAYKSLDAEIGIQKGKWGFLLTGNLFEEDGWRDFSPSSSGRLLWKASRKTSKNISRLTFNYSKSNFLGNGAVPIELLRQDRSAVFTHPDKTDNQLVLLSLHHTWLLNKKGKLQALIYYKNRDTQTFNGDDSSYEPCEEEGQEGLMCTEDEEGESPELVIDQFGENIPATESVLSAVNNRTSTKQNNLALALQYQTKGNISNLPNRFLVGQRLEMGYADYDASTELAMLTPTRGTVGSGIFDQDQFTDVRVNVLHWSAFAADWLDLFDHRLTLQAAARVNYSDVSLRDQIGVELNGDHTYFHLNPSLGGVWHLKKEQQIFLNYSLSSRTPTPVELTCADPDDPCRLPNSFLADPPLEQVIAATLEAGWRGKHRLGQFKILGFYSKVRNDIYFVSAGPARNSGYFRNLSRTSRRGIELEYTVKHKPWEGLLSFNLINASFDEAYTLSSPHHPDAVEGETLVEKGNALPLIPNYTIKFYGSYSFGSKLRLGLMWNYYSQQFIRGDESNSLDFNLPAFHFVHLDGKFILTKNWSIFGEVKNLLNQEYNTFGLLGEPDEIDEFEDFEDPVFLTPASPRLIRLGLKYSW